MIVFVRQVLKERGGRTGLILVLSVLLLAVLGPYLAIDPNKIDAVSRFQGPGLGHWMGTDNLGRDLFARVASGTRTAVLTALIVIGLASTAGMFAGITAGYLGGIFDAVVVMIFDIVSSFPIYILIFAVVALYGAGLDKLIFIMALIFTPQFGRMARAQMQSLRQRSFIEVEALMGLSTFKILLRHVLPNVIGPRTVVAGMNIPAAIAVEVAISYWDDCNFWGQSKPVSPRFRGAVAVDTGYLSGSSHVAFAAATHRVVAGGGWRGSGRAAGTDQIMGG